MATPAFDDARFERILRETQGLIRAHIAGMGVPVDEVDDVAQEVYLDFARHPERIPPDVEVLRWLRGMARNCSYEYFRRRARQAKHLTAIAELLADPEPQPPAVETGEHDAEVEALRRCLDRLNQPHRALIEGYYRDGRPAAQLAEEHGRSVGAVHMVLSRLRDTLRRCLLGQLGTTP
jgi:RNA polymerase sigma-70 factor (ECF subfamily)